MVLDTCVDKIYFIDCILTLSYPNLFLILSLVLRMVFKLTNYKNGCVIWCINIFNTNVLIVVYDFYYLKVSFFISFNYFFLIFVFFVWYQDCYCCFIFVFICSVYLFLCFCFYHFRLLYFRWVYCLLHSVEFCLRAWKLFSFNGKLSSFTSTYSYISPCLFMA